MASNYHLATALLTISLFQLSFSALFTQPHNATFFQYPLTINLVWYGKFTPTQRTIIVDFLHSLKQSHQAATPPPSVASWWKTIDKYHNGSSETVVGKQILDENYSLGMNLKNYHIQNLAIKVSQPNSINVVLTAKEVGVEGFCNGWCGNHGSMKTMPQVAYAWVGDSETQCPNECAWPFHEPTYGPQLPPLVSPNGDVGVDGMVIKLATVLADAATMPLQAGYVCAGVFGPGAHTGYPGRVLVDKMTGASYNAHGLSGRKYLVPAIWDPKKSVCSLSV